MPCNDVRLFALLRADSGEVVTNPLVMHGRLNSAMNSAKVPFRVPYDGGEGGYPTASLGHYFLWTHSSLPHIAQHVAF